MSIQYVVEKKAPSEIVLAFTPGMKQTINCSLETPEIGSLKVIAHEGHPIRRQ